MNIYWRTFLKKFVKDEDTFPFGIKIFDGVQGSGKSLSMVFEAVQLQKKYGDVNLITNIAIDYKFKNYIYFEKETIKESIDSLIEALELSNNWTHTLVIIDEALTYFAENGGIDPALMNKITQNRKSRRIIFIGTQSFKRVNNRLRDFSLETVKCGNIGRFQYNLVRDDRKLHWDKEEMDFIGVKKYSYIFKRNKDLFDLYDTFQKTKVDTKIKIGNTLTTGGLPPPARSESLEIKVKKGWL